MTQEAKIILSIGVVTLAVTLAVVFFLGKSSSPTSSSTKAEDRVLGLLTQEDSHKIATDSAKVTVVEFSDFQCPACRAAQPTVKKLVEDYQGRVNFVYRHFPLPQHKNALVAAKAAEAAGEQEKFWEMHDILFDKQEEWAESDKPLEYFNKYAQQLNLDLEKFKQAAESNKYEAKINGDLTDGRAVGINATPTFFINGQKFPGVLSYNEFKTQVEARLK